MKRYILCMWIFLLSTCFMYAGNSTSKWFKKVGRQAKKDFGVAHKKTKKTVAYPAELLKEQIRKKYPFKQTLTDEQLAVRQSTDLCPRELRFLENRKPKVRQALKQYFDVDDQLNIGITCSGGGNRAMLVALGFLLAAEDIGLYQSTLYLAGLSGGTWTISPFSYCHAKFGMTLTQFRDQLVGRMDSLMKKTSEYRGYPVFSKDEQDDYNRNFLKRFSYGQFISSMEMYGAFIGDYTLLPAEKTEDDKKNNRRFKVTWSDMADKIQEGNMPLPMGSAVSVKDDSKEMSEYCWFEVGPFEVGSEQLKSYVPVQGFGAKYKKGGVVSGYAGHTPEYPISFYEGVFGSAFTGTFEDLRKQGFIKGASNIKFRMFGKNISIPIQDFFEDTKAGEQLLDGLRISPATFHNYTFELDGFPQNNKEKLKLFDGGVDFNSPIPLVMRQARQVDVVVVCDAMEVDLRSLQLAALHFKRNNIKFPDLTNVTQDMIAKPMTVLNDPRSTNYDKDMVTILYCPFAKNNSCSATFDPGYCRENEYCNVANFNYTKEQAETLVNHMRCNLNSVKDEVKLVLQALQAKKKENQQVA